MNVGMKKTSSMRALPAGRNAKASEVEKVTISLRPNDLDTMRRFAATWHQGNLSGAFAGLIAHARRLEAMDRVLAELPKPSARGLARLEAELAEPTKKKKKKAA
jgi:hypothetical protein